mmetsp:Transcript_25421/g.80272  ORF Transcript_25421/g.80272 Transcript_25421/m.80272 type:complete len:236 (-) Transcript_25421:2462-3169(-)
MCGHGLAKFDVRLGHQQLRPPAGIEPADEEGAVVVQEAELGLALRIRGLGGGGGALRIEEELEIKGDVAVAPELGEVLGDQVLRVGNIHGDVCGIGGEGEVCGDAANPLHCWRLELGACVPLIDLGQGILRRKVVERPRPRRVELRRVARHRRCLGRQPPPAKRKAVLAQEGSGATGAAKVEAGAGGFVCGQLSHDGVGDGGEASNDCDPHGVQRSRGVQTKNRRREVLGQALEQ